jgi:hypothetical protein
VGEGITIILVVFLAVGLGLILGGDAALSEPGSDVGAGHLRLGAAEVLAPLLDALLVDSL